MVLHEELEALAAAFAAGGVDDALVGGLALAVWGAPRATGDIGVLVQPAMKLAAGQPQDEADVVRLREMDR